MAASAAALAGARREERVLWTLSEGVNGRQNHAVMAHTESSSSDTPPSPSKSPAAPQPLVEKLIFASRWVQAPLYLGLIVAGVLYAFKFAQKLWEEVVKLPEVSEEQLMMGVLTLVDITMVANLLVMVIIGGWATFVSRLDIDGHPDKPDWLDHIDAGTLKVKLAGSLVGVSGIHLLQTFISVGGHGGHDHDGHGDGAVAVAQAAPAPVDNDAIMWQVIIHVVFLVSSIMLAWTERVLAARHAQH